MSPDKRALSVNQVFAYRLRDARLSKRWTQQNLADEMERIGHHPRINRATIAKIEAFARGVGGEIHRPEPIRGGQMQPRPVSLKEAIAFAVALDVAPTNLYLPILNEDDVELAPGKVVDVETARAWAKGEKSLSEDDRFYRLQAPYEKPRKATRADLESLDIRIADIPGTGPTPTEFTGLKPPRPTPTRRD